MKKEMSGSKGNNLQWRLPIGKNTGKPWSYIDTINTENYRCRRVIDTLDKLIDMSIQDPESKLKSKDSIKHDEYGGETVVVYSLSWVRNI